MNIIENTINYLDTITSLPNAIFSWDGYQLCESQVGAIFPREVKKIYEISVGERKVKLSSDHGFWSLDGSKVKPSDVIIGETRVFIKDENSIILKHIDSVEEVDGSFIVFDVVGADYENYLYSDFILHNFDLNDYVYSGFIGKGNTKNEFHTYPWLDAKISADATFEAFNKAFVELMLAATAKAIRWDDQATKDAWEVGINDYVDARNNAIIKKAIFWNSVIPEDQQLTGEQSVSVSLILPWEEVLIDVGGITASFVRLTMPFDSITYDLTGTQDFQEHYWTEYSAAFKELLASIKRFLALSTGFKIGEDDYPGEIPPFGFREMVSPV